MIYFHELTRVICVLGSSGLRKWLDRSPRAKLGRPWVEQAKS
jgi:hypothetical protein